MRGVLLADGLAKLRGSLLPIHSYCHAIFYRSRSSVGNVGGQRTRSEIAFADKTGLCTASAMAMPRPLAMQSITPVVHVQPVGQHERLKRHVIDFAPVLHHIEAWEQVDVFALRGCGDQFDHTRDARLYDYLRRELRIQSARRRRRRRGSY